MTHSSAPLTQDADDVFSETGDWRLYNRNPPRLPKLISDAIFYLPDPELNMNKDRKIFYYENFFIVTMDLVDVLRGSHNEIQVTEVRTKRYDGSQSKEKYYAVCPTTILDCIDPELSVFRSPFNTQPISFSQKVYRSKINPKFCEEYENDGNCKYTSYPNKDYLISKIFLQKNFNKENRQWFQAKFLPGFTFAHIDFISDIRFICRILGVTDCFWSLRLDHISEDLHSENRASM